MAAFPRTVMPKLSTPFRYGSPLLSVTQSGKLQLRSFGQIGHVWDEVFGPIKMTDPVVRGWWSQVMALWQGGTVFDIVHQFYATQNGVGGGTPLVNGASQSGTALITDGWTPSITGILKAGDIIRLGGVNPIFELTADLNSDSGGHATMALNPGIPASLSPADNASITYTGVTLKAALVDIPVIPATGGAAADYFQDQIILTFMESW